MASKQYRNRQFNGGVNTLDAEHAMNDTYATICRNVRVGNGYVETRNGLTLLNEDTGETGGITMMTAAYFRDGTKQLVFANADHYYAMATTFTSATSWTDLGDYGTESENPFAYMYKDYIEFGTGVLGNTQKKYNGATMTDVTTPADPASDIRFQEYHQGNNLSYILAGGSVTDSDDKNNSTLWAADDPDDYNAALLQMQIGGNDGQKLTAIKSHSNIIAYKDNSAYRIDAILEPSTSSAVLRVLERFQDIGAVNHEVCQVAVNDIISLSPRHGVRGFQQTQTSLGGSESRRYTTKIKPLLDQINWEHAGTRARSIVYNEKYYLAVPFGGSTTNNIIFVGHLDSVTDIGEIPWTVYEMNAGSFCICQDGNGIERLLIGDSNEPKIYEFDPNSLSDNGANISAQWRSKKLDMGDIEIDKQDHIILAGAMTEPTEIDVTVMADGNSTGYKITNKQIYSVTEAVWSHIIGNEVVGGNSTGYSRPRWIAILSLPDALRESNEIQIDLKSTGQGYYWRLDYISINENININKFADKHFVDAEV